MKALVKEHIYYGPRDMDNGEGIDYRSGKWAGSGAKGENWDYCNSINNKRLIKNTDAWDYLRDSEIK